MIIMKVRGYITHKPEELHSDCADYFAINTATNKVAVADGVGQSIFPLEWAKLLVESFINEKWSDFNNVSEQQAKWLTEVTDYIKKQQDAGEVTFIVENSIAERDGAGSTFCGFHAIDKSNWSCDILGDTCLIKYIDGQIEICTSQASLDNNRPDYYDSFLPRRGNVAHFEGKLKPNDFLLLVSDPFSGLMYQRLQSDTSSASKLVNKLINVSSDLEFCELVKCWREYEGMHIDDSTLVIIEYDGNDAFTDNTELTLEQKIENESININNDIANKQNNNIGLNADKNINKTTFLVYVDHAYEQFMSLENSLSRQEQTSFFRYLLNFFDKKGKKYPLYKEYFTKFWMKTADELFD